MALQITSAIVSSPSSSLNCIDNFPKLHCQSWHNHQRAASVIRWTISFLHYTSLQYTRHQAALHTFSLVKSYWAQFLHNRIAQNLKHEFSIIFRRAQCHHSLKILHNSCSVVFSSVFVSKTQCKTRTVILSPVLNQVVWNSIYTSKYYVIPFQDFVSPFLMGKQLNPN